MRTGEVFNVQKIPMKGGALLLCGSNLPRAIGDPGFLWASWGRCLGSSTPFYSRVKRVAIC